MLHRRVGIFSEYPTYGVVNGFWSCRPSTGILCPPILSAVMVPFRYCAWKKWPRSIEDRKINIEDLSHSVYLIFVLAVFLEDAKIAVNSSASFNNGSTRFFFNSFSYIINSNQNAVSSASSKTTLNFAVKLGFDCDRQVAL